VLRRQRFVRVEVAGCEPDSPEHVQRVAAGVAVHEAGAVVGELHRKRWIVVIVGGTAAREGAVAVLTGALARPQYLPRSRR